MLPEIQYQDGRIVLVKVDKQITMEALKKKIKQMAEYRRLLSKKKDRLDEKLQQVQSKLNEYKQVLSQAGGS